ncbi:MAG: S9 family peptidase, partial [Verrucomicrobiota bacterium]
MKLLLCVAAIFALWLVGCCGTHVSSETKNATADSVADPYLWLEDVTGEKALDWVRQQNAVTVKELENAPDFKGTRQKLLSILNSKERIPGVIKRGKFYYNFWMDEKNPRGLWRRTTLDEYRKAEPRWEIVLDLDRLAADEKENWVWKGAAFLEPDFDRAIVSLSRGGADALVEREFDLERNAFVPDGFKL